METDFTKAIKAILTKSFPDYIPRHIDDVADRILDRTGRVDYRLRFVEMCEKNIEKERNSINKVD